MVCAYYNFLLALRLCWRCCRTLEATVWRGGSWCACGFYARLLARRALAVSRRGCDSLPVVVALQPGLDLCGM